MRGLLFALLVGLALLPAAQASPGPDERLEDAALEQRARGLYRELRCVVCQSQSIDASNAPLAEDMRAVVRERLAAGDSDAEIRAYMHARYGDYVLMMPPMQSNTLALWLVPLIALGGGALAIVLYIRHQRRRPDDLDEALDEERAAQLLDEEGLE